MLDNALKLKKISLVAIPVAILLFMGTAVYAAASSELPIAPVHQVNPEQLALQATMEATEDAIARNDFARFKELTVGTVIEGEIDEVAFAQMVTAHSEMTPMPPEPEGLPAIDSVRAIDPELEAMVRATEDAIARNDFARFQKLTVGTVIEGKIDEAVFAQMVAAHSEMTPMPPGVGDMMVNDEVVKLIEAGKYDEAQKLVETVLFPLPQE